MGQATNDLLSTLTEFVPRLVGAAALLLVTLVLALLLQRLMARFLEGLGLDELFERTGAANSLWQLGYAGGPSRLLGTVLFWGVMLTGVAGSLSVLGLSSLESTMDQIVNLSGRALVALVILIAGIMSAGWLAELVAREAEQAGLRGSSAFRARCVHHHSRRLRPAGRGPARPRDLRCGPARRRRARHCRARHRPRPRPGPRPPLLQPRGGPLSPRRHRGWGRDLRRRRRGHHRGARVRLDHRPLRGRTPLPHT